MTATDAMPATPDPGGRPDLHAPADVVQITRRLEQAGFSTWAVGGAVRDALAGRVPADWDLATAARPREVQRLFRRTVPVGVDHGTVGVLGRDGRMYEVTTFRRDVETDGRHAVVRFSDTVEDDLQRRDFTMNAVAWHPLTHEIRDPHGGVEDLRAGTLRTVGEPADRFREDRLRLLRALRFAGRFGLTVHPATWQAGVDIADELPALSAERVREELMKTMREVERPSHTLRLYAGCGALRSLYPELQACIGVPDGDGDVWSHLLAATDAVPRHRPVLRVTALLHDVGKAVAPWGDEGGEDFPGHAGVGAALTREVMRRLKFSNADADRAVHLVAQHSGLPAPDAPAPEVRRWLRGVGPAYVWDLLRLRVADARARGDGAGDALASIRALRGRVRGLLSGGAALEITDLAIGGAELRALGIPPGPLFGEILRDLLERVTDDPSLNDAGTLTEIVRARIS
ncbi:MAG TPA: CCA tRNA nucleotidyltransferase [Longimicrobiaceae bacterium]|nr:CCA tRNA nucleotidyltransferase [Longimicrobiaceae bacterium]